MKHFILAIDTSYSMYIIMDRVIRVVDKFLQQLKNNAFENSINDIYISVVAFNTKLTYLIKLQNIRNFHNLFANQFQIWGATALYDCIHSIVNDYDIEAEHQLIAKDAISQAGIAPNRVRLINGRANEVLDRLTESAYDIVLIAGKPLELSANISRALILLRTGGVLIIDRALWNDKLADPAQRDPDTMSMRQAIEALATGENFVGSLLPVGGGLLVAVKA